MSGSRRTWLELLLDGETPDWASLEKVLGPESPELARARRTAQLCQALADSRQQGPEHAPDHLPDQAITFRWGHLEVRNQIGHGSSGTVYRAFDTVLERDVALKLLDDSPIRARAFIAEARRLAQVRHANVLAVYGAAVHDGRAGLWSDLIDGLSLDQWIEANGPRSAAEVLNLGQSLAAALEAVHAAGLVHGDVKPGNILRETGSNRIVLMDFGSAGDHEFAARHGLLGSPASMAPEQKRGDSVGPAADIYGLGVVLFHAASGRYPSAANSEERSESATIFRSLALPRALCRLIQEMLALEPKDRPTASTVFRRLERIAAAPQRRRRQAGWVTVIAALAVGMGISLWQANNARQQAVRATLEADRAERSLAFMASLFHDGDPRNVARVDSIDSLLAIGVERAQTDLGGDAILQGTVILRLAEVYYGRRQFQDARDLVDNALELLEPALQDSDARLADAYYVAGSALGRLGQGNEAEPMLRQAVARYRLVGNLQRTGDALSEIAGVKRQTENARVALELQQQILDETETRQGSDHAETVRRRQGLAIFAEEVGDYVLAEEQLRMAIASMERLGLDGEVTYATALLNLASLMDRVGNSVEAGTLFERAIDLRIQIYGEHRGPVVDARFFYGIYLLGQRLPKAAEDSFRYVLEAAGISPGMRGHGHRYLGIALREQSRIDEAIEQFEAAERIYLDQDGTVWLLQAHRSAADRGYAVSLAGDPQRAAQILTTAVAEIAAIRGDDNYALIRPLMHLGDARAEAGDLAAAKAASERAAVLAETLLENKHQITVEAMAHRDRIAALP